MNSTHEQSELARSASEASKIVVRPVRSERYLNPRADTPFPLEYAFHLLGDVKDKLVLDLGCGSGEEVIPLLRRGARVIGIDLSPKFA
jgi:methylase of polypeptide subunit release factors